VKKSGKKPLGGNHGKEHWGEGESGRKKKKSESVLPACCARTEGGEPRARFRIPAKRKRQIPAVRGQCVYKGVQTKRGFFLNPEKKAGGRVCYRLRNQAA